MNKDIIKIAAVGDISLGDEYLRYGCGVRAKIQQEGTDFIFQHVSEQLSRHDLVFGNLEGVLSSENFNKYKLSSCPMRGLPEAAESLTKAGFTILSLANNHIMQHGRKAVVETYDLLKEKNIACCGLNGVTGQSLPNGVFERKGVKIGFMAYNAHSQQYFIDDPVYKRFELHAVIEDLKKHKKSVDVIIVSLHWGDEFVSVPSPTQQDIAHELIDAGADVILGHHPHVVQGIEKYQTGLIFYSLGNFVFDLSWYPKSNDTFIASLSYDIANNRFDYEIIPVRINNNFQPEILNGSEAQKSINHLHTISKKIIDNASKNKTLFDKQYESMVRVAESQERRLSHAFWRKHFWRYPAVIILQYVKDIAKRRLRRVLHVARIFRKHKLHIPVLMYHEVYDQDNSSLDQIKKYSLYAISDIQFSEQMQYLYENGYTTISPSQLLTLVNNTHQEKDKNEKYVLITFDDGYTGNYKYAYPLLLKYGFKAWIFVIVNRINTKNHMTLAQLRELQENGMTIQSHTLSHRDLELLSKEEMKQELETSKILLETQIEQPVEFISYPQGSYNSTIFKMTKEAGYTGSFTAETGHFSKDDLFRINRIHIRPQYNLDIFKKIINNDYWLFKKLRIMQSIKRTIRKTIGLEMYGKIWLKRRQREGTSK